MVSSRKLDLKVAYVEGDNLLPRIHDILKDASKDKLPHLDKSNANIQLAKDTKAFLENVEQFPVVSANAYLGMRAIRKGLELGADIIICGRAADASPVIAAAAWWHSWKDTDYDELAGALVAGHLIECSTYITGANFAGFYKYDIDELLNLGLPIVEVHKNGECVVTKHEALPGFVTADTVKCQLLYELQGNIYLNSDVKADIKRIKVEDIGKDRVQVSGVKGFPPPATTKLAVFYKGGWQNELLFNATGFATAYKFKLHEAQMRSKLKDWGLSDAFDILDFQVVGRPMSNPDCQLASTTYLRVFAQAKDPAVLGKLVEAWQYNTMAHFAGFHSSLDFRSATPKPYLAYYPGIVSQSDLEESVTTIDREHAAAAQREVVGPPKRTEPLEDRESYDPTDPVDIAGFGPTIMRPLGDIALGRSGDKGANVNAGFFVHKDDEWDWLRSFMTKAQLRKMMGSDWQDWYFIERVEMAEIKAVHFVVYGPLGRGVSSSKILDALGKGFAEFIRDVHVPIPKRFLDTGGPKL